MQRGWETRLHIRGLNPGSLAGFDWEEACYPSRTPRSRDGFGLGGDSELPLLHGVQDAAA